MQFDDFAYSYEQNAFIQRDLIAWAEPFLNVIPIQNQAVIELGAGTGSLTSILLQNNPTHILATDKSSSMIVEGSKRVPQADWQLMDAWDAAPRLCDHIFSSSLLQWAPDAEKTIKHWAHHLPKGGTIHAIFFIDQTLIELRRLMPFESTIEWKTQGMWEMLFKKAGLDILLSREVKKTYYFPSCLDLLKNLKHTGAALKNHLCGKELKRVIKDYDQRFYTPQGSSSTWHFCQVIGQK